MEVKHTLKKNGKQVVEVTYLTFDGNNGRSRSREDGRQGTGGTAPMYDGTCRDHRYLIRFGSL